MGYDTDGTHWMTVRYTVDIQVIADSTDEAIYFADLAFAEQTIDDFDAKVVED